MVTKIGPYVPHLDVQDVKVETALTITKLNALHLKATRAFTDVYGLRRLLGDECLVTRDQTSLHLVDVNEKLVGVVDMKFLTKFQYCVLCNSPDDKGNPQLGAEKVVRGPCNFFLQPGEYIEDNCILDVFHFGENQGALISAVKAHTDVDDEKIQRKAGERWIITGPREFVPSIHVRVEEVRSMIVLPENEGIYIRDTNTGGVRCLMGPATYLLGVHEELWNNELAENVEDLLYNATLGQHALVAGRKYNPTPSRDKTRAVTYKVPANTAVQIYEYSQEKSLARVVIGPRFVVLGPHEVFTVIQLSGGKPKLPNQIQCLQLQLGPDFMTDIVEVETVDHARLSLRLCYKWHFELEEGNLQKAFEVKNFVGDACKQIASRIRGKVSRLTFEKFHQTSNSAIVEAIFGKTKEGEPAKTTLIFQENGLVIDAVDIQNVSPVDNKTLESLQRSVQLAIEITARTTESSYRHQAQLEEQKAKGILEVEKLHGNMKSEIARTALLTAQAQCAAVETCGQKVAEAKGRKETQRIEAKSEIDVGVKKIEAAELLHKTQLEVKQKQHAEELKHKTRMNELEVEKRCKLAEIEAKKFQAFIQALGADTLTSVSEAPDQLKSKLMAALGLGSGAGQGLMSGLV